MPAQLGPAPVTLLPELSVGPKAASAGLVSCVGLVVALTVAASIAAGALGAAADIRATGASDTSRVAVAVEASLTAVFLGAAAGDVAAAPGFSCRRCAIWPLIVAPGPAPAATEPPSQSSRTPSAASVGLSI